MVFNYVTENSGRKCRKRRFPNVPFVLVDCCIVDDVIEENYHEIKRVRQFNEVNCSFMVRNREMRDWKLDN